MPSHLQLIEAKRDGATLSDSDLQFLVDSVIADAAPHRIPDEQLSAFLMAVLFRGLDPRERRTLTLAMRNSGETLHLPRDPTRPVVDKHSTGGVGDKVSLPLAPLLACLGFRVPMLSGRGLGITGGTLDKLESIPGFNTRLSARQIESQVDRIGVAMAGQTETMVPSDRRLYALRDITGTVPSPDLITASILSKKLAEDLDCLLLDVKCGSGAFLPDPDAARDLAQKMVQLATDCGVQTVALLTEMDSPLGRSAGNWLEVRESIQCLSGGGPADLRELTLAFAAQILIATRRCPDPDSALAQAADCLDSGAPLQRWNDLLLAQGADPARLAQRLCTDSLAPAVGELRAARPGHVSRCNARIIGEVIRDLGGGRLSPGDVIRPEVGLDQIRKPGEAVSRHEPLCRVHATSRADLDRALDQLGSAFEISDAPTPSRPLIREVLFGDQPNATPPPEARPR
jgi:pyrimidine-nucleoside phosphorylase